MSKLQTPTNVRYFISCLYCTNSFVDFSEVELIISKLLPSYNSFEPSFNPLLTYYSKEMGDNLKRVIFYASDFNSREDLVGLKIKATDLELKYSNENKRLINLDVGYIAKEQVILATGKPYSHRVYLDAGVYAELTYVFKEKTFNSLPWTYPDYAHDEKIKLFNSLR